MTDADGLTITVVRTPGAMTDPQWRLLRRIAPGPRHHELRLRAAGAGVPSGTQLESALRRWAEDAVCGSQRWRALIASDPLTAPTSAEGELFTVPANSPKLHDGMVVLLTPPLESINGLKGGQVVPRPTYRRKAHSLWLCVDRGPDSGQLARLPRGRHTVGRTVGALRLADPSAARKHLTVEVGSTGVIVSCADDAPKVVLDGRSKRRAVWDSSTELLLGSSVLQLVSGPVKEPSGEVWPPIAETVHAEPPQGRHRMVLLMALLPMVIGIVLVIVTGMWFFLLFSALSGLVALATAWDARRRRRTFHQATTEAGRRWASRAGRMLATPGELIRLLRTAPTELSSPLLAGSSVRAGWDELTWPAASSGSPATPVLRAGSGLIRPHLQLGSATEPPQKMRVHGPVVVTLSAGAHTVISGSTRESRRLFRWLLVQLLLRPAGQRPQVLLTESAGSATLAPSPAPDHPDLEQCTAEELRERMHHGGQLFSAEKETKQHMTPVLMAPEGLDPRLLTQAEAEGVHVLLRGGPHCVPALPSLRSGAALQLDHGRALELITGEPEALDVVFDGLSAQTAEEHLRLGLAHCAGSQNNTALPPRCERPLPATLMWRRAVEELTALIGRGSGTDEHLDLVTDGPHILLAGTTGSGKSELLKSLLLGWASRYGPDEVNFMLFDFKGGSTFHQIARLEHSLGLVTDLSQAQAERTLEGLRSELVRRERLFLEAEAGDYTEYRRRQPQAPLPRLLVVFDEFRIFSHELPDTMDELMRLATLGRSLGLHLVLATQRPQGVVTADIRANIGSVLALRLRNGDESRDLVGTEEAWTVPRELPGRGILRRPGDQPCAFQTAQLTSAEAPLTMMPEAAEAGTSDQHAPSAEPPSAGELVSMLQRAGRVRGLRRSHSPIQPPLPEQLSDAEIRELTDTSEGEALLGLLDEPAEQRRLALTLDPQRPRSLALLGEGESGGREALLALTRQLLTGPSKAHLHLLDGDRSLEELSDHPRVSSWVAEEHPAEAEHLLERMKEELQRRRAGRAQAVPEVLLMSGHGQWHAAAQTSGLSGLDHALGTLISEGPAVGISVLIAGGRELASGRLGSRLSRRVLLPFGVAEETRQLWPRVRSTDPLPGRGVLVSPEHPAPGIAVQLVVRAVPVQGAPAVEPCPGDGAVRIRPLPERLPEAALPEAPVLGPGARGRNRGLGPIAVGIEQFTHAPAMLELGSVSLITGLPGTGRSSCLALLARRVPGTIMWRRAEVPTGCHTGQPTAAPRLLLVDDADQLTEAEHREIEQLVLSGVPVLASAKPSMMLFSTIPWAHHARISPGNVLLSPTQRAHADPHPVNVPLLDHLIPGRAVHLRPEGPRTVQWAQAATPPGWPE